MGFNHRKILVATIIFCIIIIVLLFLRQHGLGILYSPSERYFYQNINKISMDENKALLLNNFTNFEWDKVCVYSGYSPSEEPTYMVFYQDDEIIRKIYGFQRKFQNIFNDFINFGRTEDQEKCFNNNVKVFLTKEKYFSVIRFNN